MEAKDSERTSNLTTLGLINQGLGGHMIGSLETACSNDRGVIFSLHEGQGGDRQVTSLCSFFCMASSFLVYLYSEWAVL